MAGLDPAISRRWRVIRGSTPGMTTEGPIELARIRANDGGPKE